MWTVAATVAARLEEVAGLLGAARRIVVFSGAGISTESGIPDSAHQGACGPTRTRIGSTSAAT